MREITGMSIIRNSSHSRQFCKDDARWRRRGDVISHWHDARYMLKEQYSCERDNMAAFIASARDGVVARLMSLITDTPNARSWSWHARKRLMRSMHDTATKMK